MRSHLHTVVCKLVLQLKHKTGLFKSLLYVVWRKSILKLFLLIFSIVASSEQS